MVNSTTQQRIFYAPPCSAKKAIFLAAYEALDASLRQFNYAPRLGVTGAFNCRKITGGTGYSLHAYGPGVIFAFWTGVRVTMALAVDVNWDKNPYGPRLVTDMPRAMVDAILAIRTNNGKQVWGWGGYYVGNKDAMHFEIVCSPADLVSGIASSSTPMPVENEDEDMQQIMWFESPVGAAAYLKEGGICKWIPTGDHLSLLRFVKVSEINGPGNPLSQQWQDVSVIVDGPCQNTFSKRIEEWGTWLDARMQAAIAGIKLPDLDVDEGKIVAGLATLLSGMVTSLDATELAAIAKATADEIARRGRE